MKPRPEGKGVLVAYYRVSTRKQGRSGLGLEAQREIVREFAQARQEQIVAHFTELESGKSVRRPELLNALTACRLHRATLVVAKLDRLARNAAFLLSLRDSGVDLVACDLPSMNRMTVGIMAVVAEEEARMISERTKSALRSARNRGVRLGTPGNLTMGGRERGVRRSVEVRRAQAVDRAQDLAPIFAELCRDGSLSLREIARRLDERGISTPHGKAWTATAVRRAIALSKR